MVLFDRYKYNKSFAVLAKESNFTFNLYRGRVDWTKLESLDVDRLVRDQDVELLNIHMSCVTNCNLESEYDLKIFDPNFVKLFKLAQLLIDFLLHCKHYLEHCIQVAHESLQVTNKEVEILQKKLQASKTKVKRLKEKVSELKIQLLHHPNIISGTTFECSLCGKTFLNNTYLQGHITRRHSLSQSDSQALKPINIETQPSSQSKKTSSDLNVGPNQPEGVKNDRKMYHEEIEEFKKTIFAEIKKLKEIEKKKVQSSVGSKFDSDPIKNDCQSDSKENIELNVEVSSNPKHAGAHIPISESKGEEDQNSESKSKEMEVEWQKRLEDREGVWRARLSAIDHQHKQQVNQLQEKLTSSLLQGQEVKNKLESRLEEAIKRIEKSEALMAVKVKAAEESSQKLIIDQENTNKSTSPLSIDSVETIEDKPPLKENPQSTCASQLHPFRRRSAFMYEQSKTIKEDLHELIPQKRGTDKLENKLKSDEERDIEIDTIISETKLNEGKKLSVYTQPQLNEYSKRTVDKNETPMGNVTYLLNNQKDETYTINKDNDDITNLMNKESSISETLTDTESESSYSLKQVDNTLSKLSKTNYESDDLLLNTETQLTQESLKCMEALLAANPKIMEQLRADLKQLLNRRLQGLGVDPGWAGVPPATFNLKMDLLAHQRRITAKSHKIYFTLRDKLNSDADALVRSRPVESTTDSLLERLRKKAAQVISVSKFTRQLGVVKTKGRNDNTAPLAASSPKALPKHGQQEIPAAPTSNANKISEDQSLRHNDSLSLSSSPYDEEEEDEPKPNDFNQTGTERKSVLRNAMSTGNIAKKKVFFADQEFNADKRSMSENSVEMRSPVAGNVSVASLVQEIKQQLSLRKEKPVNSVDVGGPLATSEVSTLPLSQILPLTKSGRELLESEHLHMKTFTPAPKLISRGEKSVTQNIQTLSHIVKKVPLEKPVLSDLTGPAKMAVTKDIRQPVKLSPVPSLTSISSSLLDVSASHSPRGFNWDIQELEDNMKD